MTFLSKLENKDAFKPDGGYDNGRHRYGYLSGALSEVKERPMRTSIGCLCQLFLGTPPSEIMGATQWFMNTEGERGGGLPNKDKTNVYYWYYGTLVTFQVGGEEWKKWNEALKPVLTDTQRQDGDARGSWNPEKTPGAGGGWGNMWGRVGQTALSALCLEVYYRYAKLSP
jgi:hypothetical protein